MVQLENAGIEIANATLSTAGGDVPPAGPFWLLEGSAEVVSYLVVQELDLNVVAIALFIELTALPSGVAIVFAGLDAIVLAALIRHRAWFDPAAWPLEPAPDLPAGQRPRR